MSNSGFEHLPQEEQDWIDAYLDGTITSEHFDRLQDRLAEDPALRALMRRYLSVDSFLHTESVDEETAGESWLSTPDTPSAKKKFNFISTAIAASIAFLLGALYMNWQGANGEQLIAETDEPSAQGFAVVQHLFDPVWPLGQAPHREGDTLSSEVFQLEKGTSEIQFFSGAVMTIEGPAEISLISAWEAACSEGAIRMHVPPAARGFKLQAPTTEIIDLGTEFGLSVRNGKAHVEVFDGEIALRHQDGPEKLVQAGAAFGLPTDGPLSKTETGTVPFPDLKNFGTRAIEKQQSDFARWQHHRDLLAQDQRLILYSTFDEQQPGTVVLAEPVDGRWPGLKPALEFRRPGARVRTNIPGTFKAFTFTCWVRIDSLDRQYNALFMGDGYENGEPHWQIRDDGKLMLSVMVDDRHPHPKMPKSAGLHRVYFSPPMWDLSMSGKWMHLASVFDPQQRQVSHYVNGERIHQQEIEDEFFIDTLRIGNGEIGNWGQPFREDPVFAIRNLNGRMDELAIFKTALSDGEIGDLFTRSRAEKN